MIILSLGISTMKSSRTGKDLSIMVNPAHRTSQRRERQRINVPSMQALTSFMKLLEKEIQQYPLSPTRINAVIIWPEMECVIYSLYQTHSINIRNMIFFYISLYFPGLYEVTRTESSERLWDISVCGSEPDVVRSIHAEYFVK